MKSLKTTFFYLSAALITIQVGNAKEAHLEPIIYDQKSFKECVLALIQLSKGNPIPNNIKAGDLFTVTNEYESISGRFIQVDSDYLWYETTFGKVNRLKMEAIMDSKFEVQSMGGNAFE